MNGVRKGTRLATVASFVISVFAVILVTALPAQAALKLCTQWYWTNLCCDAAVWDEDLEERVCWWDSDPENIWYEQRCNFWSICP